MTRRFDEDTEDPGDSRLDDWMMASVRDVIEEAEDAVEVPREMMWARIRAARRRPAAGTQMASWLDGTARRSLAAAALLIVGIAIGRYSQPDGHGGSSSALADGSAVADGQSVRGNMAVDVDDPLSVAMREHLSRSVSLLTMVRNENPRAVSDSTLGPAARDLLITTRLLLDEPRLQDATTRPVLQDLELVLLQIIQARPAAPETQAAPRETMFETNLLPRVKAVVTASAAVGQLNENGDGLP